MKTKNQLRAVIIILLGLAMITAAAVLTAYHLVPTVALLLLLSGFLLYFCGGIQFSRARGQTAVQGVVACCFPILLFLLQDKSKMSKADQEEYERMEREDEDGEKARRAEMRRPLKGPKKAVVFLLGLFFMILGLAIIVGYQIYWARIIAPERNSLAVAISVVSDKVDPQKEGKLIHLTGPLAGAENLSDPEFGVTVNALRLRRHVWMYQWQQDARRPNSYSYDTEDSHGNTPTHLKTQTYHYSKIWSEQIIDSRLFRRDSAAISVSGTSLQINGAILKHDNPPTKAIPDRAVAAPNITLGVFAVAPELVEQIDDFHPVPVTEANLAAIPAPLRSRAKLLGNEIYFGTNADQPAVGDLKIKFESAPPAIASVIARQNGSNVSPYPSAHGGTVAPLRIGSYSTSEMAAQFAKAESQTRTLVWVIGCVPTLLGMLLLKMARQR
jgi:Ca2+/Na+ antiporter